MKKLVLHQPLIDFGHDCDELIVIFNRLFAERYNTVLEKGGAEPLYLAAQGRGEYHRLVFRRDYFASALHEIAHWCIAGAQRRRCDDYGYWYAPDGRNTRQQRLFEQVEAKPQALEWIFARSSGHRFRVSADNLDGCEVANEQFKLAVYQAVLRFCERNLPPRAERFRYALTVFYASDPVLKRTQFELKECEL